MAATRYNRIHAVEFNFRSDYPLQEVAYEIRFYNALNQGGTEFAMLGTAIGDAHGSYPVGNAKDNSDATYWLSSQAQMGWWGIDSGSGNAYELLSFAIKCYNGGGCGTAKKLYTESSTDGTTWTQTGAIITTSNVSNLTWQYFNVTRLSTASGGFPLINGGMVRCG